MDLKLTGKKAIVTGATRGIGRAIADTLAAEGADVAICARTRDRVDEAVAALSATGVTAIGGAVDVADGAALTAWITRAGRALGGVDILVSNATAFGVGNGAADWNGSMGRMGTPQEIADAVVFLASPVSSFTTGANLIVDGALTARVNF